MSGYTATQYKITLSRQMSLLRKQSGNHTLDYPNNRKIVEHRVSYNK